ncbi:MAG: DNA-binding protein [Bacillales bacterium]|jgi:putative molybdopterin biosynthesis protein|nr:DNA-binding protein [Bacillales bacterium]
MQGKAYKPEEVASLLQISKNTVYELIKRGDLKAFKVGNKMRIEEVELLAFKERAATDSKRLDESKPDLNQTIKIVGSHDFLLENLIYFAQGQLENIYIQPSFVGSLEGLMMLYRDQADIAAIHLLNSDTNEYNLPTIKQLFPQKDITVLRLASREQGFIVQKGNPKKILGFQDLLRENITFVNRQKGSGTRILFDQLLKKHAIHSNQVNGYEREEWTHLATASYVASGRADVTFGIGNTVDKLDLDFIPVTTEFFDLVFQWKPENSSNLHKMFDIILSNEFRVTLDQLTGYDIAEFGEIIYGEMGTH